MCHEYRSFARHRLPRYRSSFLTLFNSEKSRGRKIAFYAEDGPPTDIADRLMSSFPRFMGVGLLQRSIQAAVEYDK